MLEHMYVPWKPTCVRSPIDIQVIRGVPQWLDTRACGHCGWAEITAGSR